MAEGCVVKWDQGRQTATIAHEKDQTFMRRLVKKDFFIYSAIYIFPPLALLLNPQADYPLSFVNTEWIVKYTALTAGALCVMGLPSLSGVSSHVSSFERNGAFLAFLLRCVLTACVDAINVRHNPIQQLHLSRYPIRTVGSDEDQTAQEVYDNIMGKSRNFDPSRKTLWRSRASLICALLISVGLVSIPAALRLCNGHHILGNSFWDALCIVLSNAIMFGIMFRLSSVFFLGFTLYRSMRRSMRRLKSATVGNTGEDEEIDLRLSDDIPREPCNGKSHPLKLNVLEARNLRAWLKVHEALNLRKDGVPARLLEIGATLGLFFFSIMLLLLGWESFSESSGALLDNMADLDKTSLYVTSYLVVVLGMCMGTLSIVGNEYNRASKDLQIRNLYTIQLEATLEFHSCMDDPPPEAIAAMDRSMKLLKNVQDHLRSHIPELGLLGVSYSRLTWGITGIVSSILTRQFFRLF